jgi:hypothetical protein
MRRAGASACLLAALLGACDASKGASPAAGGTPEWGQWGAGPRHDGFVDTSGQPPARLLADVVVDPFVALEVAEGGRGALLVHYQTPLVDGDDVFIEVKGGRYAPCDPPGSGAPFPCGPAAWAGQVWSERALRWDNGVLRERWGAVSDWVPPPTGGALSGWEPVFHAALSSGFVYLPARGGSVLKLRREDGRVAARIAPFQDERNTYVAGPLTADGRGNVYYQALKLDPADPWAADAAGAWLVRVGTDDQAATVPFASLVRDAPDAGAACTGAFVAGSDPLPWPPTAFARPRTGPCGRQRPGLNAAPAVAPDGTIYTVSRAHLNARYSYLVAVGPDLQPRWAASMRGLLDDGCGRLLPPNGAAGGCRVGTTLGVDPETNERPAGRVDDNSTASPVVAPDGSVLYGAFTRYNYSRGHLLRFDASGRFLASYDFGWDVTPAVVPRGASFSVVV